MKCLNCGARNHAEDMVCLECGKSLNKTPFTPEQRTWHIFNAIAPIVTVGIIFFVMQNFIGMSSGFGVSSMFGQMSMLWWLIMGVAVVIVALSFYKHVMDLIGGVTQFHTARFIRKYRSASGRRGSRTYYAEFEQVGKVNIRFDLYRQLEEGRTYKVTFSPNTKRGWEIELQP